MVKARIKAKKRYSQNFLESDEILDFIADAADLSDSDVVVEVGAGDGRLSRRLAKRCKLYAIEIDRSLESVLRESLSGFDAVVIIDDFLNVDIDSIGRFKLISNLPYANAKRIIRKCIESDQVDSMIVCLQKEVAENYLNGDKNRCFLGCWLDWYAESRKLLEVNRNQFMPSPKVDSEIIAIYPKNRCCYNAIDKDKYMNFLMQCWKHPKKMLMNNLKIQKEQMGSFANRRAHQIDRNEFLKLYNIWSKYVERLEIKK